MGRSFAQRLHGRAPNRPDACIRSVGAAPLSNGCGLTNNNLRAAPISARQHGPRPRYGGACGAKRSYVTHSFTTAHLNRRPNGDTAAAFGAASSYTAYE